MWPRSLSYQNPRARAATLPGPVWLFDLDNTLHDASRGIFRQIHRCMTQAIADLLHINLEQANALRMQYWRQYGATLIGMVRHHDICAHEFLHRAHHFDVRPYIHHEAGLNHSLARLPGEKNIFTNAPLAYSLAVLDAVGIRHHFRRIISVEAMRNAGVFRPKPSPTMMRQVLSQLAVPARQCIFIDDSLNNLKSAARLGIQTVYFDHPGTPTPGQPQMRGLPSYVQLRVRSIRELVQQQHCLWPGRHPGEA